MPPLSKGGEKVTKAILGRVMRGSTALGSKPRAALKHLVSPKRASSFQTKTIYPTRLPAYHPNSTQPKLISKPLKKLHRRDLPPVPKTYKDLKNHLLSIEFR